MQGLFQLRQAIVVGLLFILVLPTTSLAQSTGLGSGSWTQYSVSGDLSEGVVSSRLNVVGVDRGNITVNSIDTYTDASTVSETLWLDLATGKGKFEAGFYFAIPAGIAPGQGIYPGSSLLVSARESRYYAGASRDMNYARNNTGMISYYWDVETGVFTEIVRNYVNSTTGETRLGVHVNLTATNIWSPSIPTNPTNPGRSDALIFVLGVVAAVALAVLAAVLVSRRSRSNERRKS